MIRIFRTRPGEKLAVPDREPDAVLEPPIHGALGGTWTQGEVATLERAVAGGAGSRGADIVLTPGGGLFRVVPRADAPAPIEPATPGPEPLRWKAASAAPVLVVASTTERAARVADLLSFLGYAARPVPAETVEIVLGEEPGASVLIADDVGGRSHEVARASRRGSATAVVVLARERFGVDADAVIDVPLAVDRLAVVLDGVATRTVAARRAG